MKQFLFTLPVLLLLGSCRQKAEAPPPVTYTFDKAAEINDGNTEIYNADGLKQTLVLRLKNLVGTDSKIDDVSFTMLKIVNKTEKFPGLIARTTDKKMVVAALLTLKDDAYYFNEYTAMVVCNGCGDDYIPSVDIINGEPNLVCADCKDCIKTEFFPY